MLGNGSRLYKILTYGCQANERDSETLTGLLESQGYEPAADISEADVILINTCCIRQSAENKVYGKLGELKILKRQNPNLIIGVGGCMAQQKEAAEKLYRRAPHIDILFGTHNLHRLPELLNRTLDTGKSVIDIWEREGEVVEDLPVLRTKGIRAYINIMYGCDNFCSYCIVPFVRGRERSRQPKEILKEVEAAVSQGYGEVMLLGQNVNSYGKGLEPGIDFASLLTEMDQIPGIQRIRYLTSHPKNFSDKIIRAIADSKHVCEHFHLPVQAGGNHVLRWMNRGYSREQYMELIERVRAASPACSITTDIIVGFPQETETCFGHTLNLMEWAKFDAAFTFLYSPRSGTPAAKMPDTVPLEVKKSRLQELMALQNQISLEINLKLIGQTVEVMVEGPSKNNVSRLSGRTRTNKIVVFEGPLDLTGKLVEVKITEGQTWNLMGKIVSPELGN